MLFVILEFVFLLGFGGLLYYFMSGIVNDYLSNQVALYPTAFTPEAITFTRALMHWLLLIMVVGGLFAIFVTVQRRRNPEGWYS